MAVSALNAKVTKLFFDSKEILTRLDKAEVRVLSKFGAFVMTTARRSMRKVGKKGLPSKPGQPPKERLGFLKKGRYGVTFGYDPNAKSVVIGAELFPGMKKKNSDTMPATLEYGGDILVTEGEKKDGSFTRTASKWAKINGRATRKVRKNIAARPYMAPAFKKNSPKLMGMWKDALHKV